MESRQDKPCFFLDTVAETEGGSIYVLEILTCVVNAVLALSATLGNLLVILVITKTPSLHCPSNILLCCLASSDIVIGIVTQPSFVVYKIAEILHDADSACRGRIVHWVTGFACAGVSLLTIAAIAIEKYLALHLHLRYNAIVTVPRVCKVVVAVWTFCVFAIGSLFVINSDRYWTLVPAPVAIISLSTIVVAYVKIYRIIRRHQKQIRDQAQAFSWQLHGGLTMKKYKQSTLTMVYVLVLFLLCYLPFVGCMISRVVQGYTSDIKIAYEIGATVVYVNSSLNPLLYCLRIAEIRKAALKMIRRQRENTNFLMVRTAPRSNSSWASHGAHVITPGKSICNTEGI